MRTLEEDKEEEFQGREERVRFGLKVKEKRGRGRTKTAGP
jgi:hypothetical protein